MKAMEFEETKPQVTRPLTEVGGISRMHWRFWKRRGLENGVVPLCFFRDVVALKSGLFISPGNQGKKYA